MTEAVIEIKDVKMRFGKNWVHKGINLTINRGEIIGIVGGSGSGKTTLLREMLMLRKPTSGSIKIFETEVTKASQETLLKVQRRWGVLFQQNALFSSLNVLQNIIFPLQEHTPLTEKSMQALALLKINLVGLSSDVAVQYPAELSGGMQKRAGLARAIAMDPELLFLDEPTAGLDPISSANLDDLILNLRETMGLTVVVITHDLDTLWRITDRVAFLADGKVVCVDSMKNLVKFPNELVQNFFNGTRAKTKSDKYG